MKKIILICLCAIAFVRVEASQQQPTELRDLSDSLSYVVGMQLADYLEYNDYVDLLKSDLVVKGFMDATAKDDSIFDLDDIDDLYYDLRREVKNYANREKLAEAKEFLEKKAQEPGVMSTASGLLYEILEDADGVKPRKRDRIRINYTLSNIYGEEIETSDEDPGYDELRVDGILDGIAEGLQLMAEGSEYMLYVPYELSYMDYDWYLEPEQMLPMVMRVKLLEVIPNENYDIYSDYDDDRYDYGYYDDDDDDDYNDDYDYTNNSLYIKDRGDYKIAETLKSSLEIDGYTCSNVYFYKSRYFAFTEDEMVILNENQTVIRRYPFEMELHDFYPLFYEAKNGSYPTFLVLDGKVSYDYPYGAIVYTIDRDMKTEKIGVLNISNREYDAYSYREYSYVNPILKIYNLKDGVNFIFHCDDIIYNPKGKEFRLTGSDLRYVYSKGKFELRGGGTHIEFFAKDKLVSYLEEKYSVDEDDIVFGDVNRDGQQDAVFVSEDGKKLYVVTCNEFNIVKVHSFPMKENNAYVYGSNAIDEAEGFIRVYTETASGETILKSFQFNNGKLKEVY